MTKLIDTCILLAVAIFFIFGGLIYRGTIGGHRAFLELSNFGLVLTPVFLAVLSRGGAVFVGTFAARGLMGLWRLARQQARANFCRWSWLVLSSFFLLWAYAILSRHWAFKSNWDLAIYAQACGHDLYSSLRDETTLLADHFEPMLALFSPFCRTVDAASALLLIQTLAWAVGAYGVVVLARTYFWSETLSLLLGAAYFLFTGNRQTYFYDFHLVALAGATLPWIYVAIAKRRWILLAGLALVHLGLKETCGLTLAGIGGWMLACPDSRPRIPSSREGNLKVERLVASGLVLGGFLGFLLIMQVITPYARSGHPSQYFAKYYGHLGENLGEAMRHFLVNPLLFVRSAFGVMQLKYLAKVFAPFFFAPFFRPASLFPFAAALAVNLLSSHPFLHSGNFHYEAEIYPLLFCYLVILSKEVKFLRRWRTLLQVLPNRPFRGLKRLSFRFSWALFFLTFASGKAASWHLAAYPVTAFHERLEATLATLPIDQETTRVAAFENLAPHLSRIRHLFLLNRWQEAEWIVVAFPNSSDGWLTKMADFERDTRPEIERRFDLYYSDPDYRRFEVWRRKAKT